MLTFVISFVAENMGVLLGFWRFNQPSSLPAPLIVSVSFGWPAISLLWRGGWILRMKSSVLKQSVPFMFLVSYAVMGTLSDWTNPNWLAWERFNPSFTFLLWVFVVGTPFVYSFQLSKRISSAAGAKNSS
jgi:hypothetical protein